MSGGHSWKLQWHVLLQVLTRHKRLSDWWSLFLSMGVLSFHQKHSRLKNE